MILMEEVASLKDNRFYERISCQLSFECKFYYDKSGQLSNFDNTVAFSVRNVSIGGVLAESMQDIPMDSVLEYTFYLDGVPYVVMSRVKWKVQSQEVYQYGMEFLTISNMLYRHLKAYTARLDFFERPEECGDVESQFKETFFF